VRRSVQRSRSVEKIGVATVGIFSGTRNLIAKARVSRSKAVDARLTAKSQAKACAVKSERHRQRDTSRSVQRSVR
jgi:hypothetical protein